MPATPVAEADCQDLAIKIGGSTIIRMNAKTEKRGIAFMHDHRALPRQVGNRNALN